MRLVYLLDTNVVSEPLKQNPDPTVLDRLRAHERLMCIAAVVWHELLYGMERLADGARKRRIAAYLFDVVAPGLPVLDYNASTAAIHATMRRDAEAAGSTLGFADGLIAATARANNCILVTRNTADFSAVGGLLHEDWFTPDVHGQRW